MTEIIENSQEHDGIDHRIIYDATQLAFMDSELELCDKDSVPAELQEFADDILELFIVEKHGFDVNRGMPVDVCLVLSVYTDGDNLEVGEILVAVWEDQDRLTIDFDEGKATATSDVVIPNKQKKDFVRARAISALSAVTTIV